MNKIESNLTDASFYAQAVEKFGKKNNIDQQIIYSIKAARSYVELEEIADSNDDKEFYSEQYLYYKDKAKQLIKSKSENSSHNALVKKKDTPANFNKKSHTNTHFDDVTWMDDIKRNVSNTSFDDVAGMDHIKKDIEKKIIWPLTDPENFEKYVGKGNRGIIMYGPPGCGKTLIAKAAAGEAKKYDLNTSFFKIDQGDIKDKWVGGSQKNLKNVFKAAAENQPSIVFFDEVDSLAGSVGGLSSEHNKNLLNEFKSVFDELEDKTILVVGATNYPWSLDSAMVRPGRFEQLMFVTPPDLKARAEIIRIHTKNKEIDNDLDFDKLAELTEGYSGADLMKICKDAGIKAYERNRKNGNEKIVLNDFVETIGETESSLKQWCTEVKNQLTDGRYPDKRVLRKGIPEKYEIILDKVNELEESFGKRGIF